MKKILALPAVVIILTFSIFISSCSDNAINTVTPVSSPLVSHGSTIGGPISNMSPTVRLLKAVSLIGNERHLLEQQAVGRDDAFKLELPSPTQNALMDVDLLFYGMTTNNAIISDHDAKVNYAIMHMFDASDVYRGYLQKDNRVNGSIYFEGFTKVFYLYCDRPLTITGSSKRTINNRTTEFFYDQTLNQGWNVLSQKITSIRPNYTGIDFRSGEQSETSWSYNSLDH